MYIFLSLLNPLFPLKNRGYTSLSPSNFISSLHLDLLPCFPNSLYFFYHSSVPCLPLIVYPTGFHSNSYFIPSSLGFHIVWLIQFHFLLHTLLYIHSWCVPSNNSFFNIINQILLDTCWQTLPTCALYFLLTFHVATPLSKMIFTLQLNILSFYFI